MSTRSRGRLFRALVVMGSALTAGANSACDGGSGESADADFADVDASPRDATQVSDAPADIYADISSDTFYRSDAGDAPTDVYEDTSVADVAHRDVSVDSPPNTDP